MKILSIGDIIWDIYPDDECIGGATFNFSAHCSIRGAKVWMISAVGDDNFGRRSIECARRFGVNTDFVQTNSHETGKTLVTLENGHPSYNVLLDVAYDNIEVDDALCDKLNALKCDVFYFGTLIQRLGSAAAVRKILDKCSFTDVICDINLRTNCYNRNSTEVCLSNATVLKVSSEEEPLLREFGFYNVDTSDEGELSFYERVSVALCEKYKQLKVVLFTLGSRGSLAYEKATGKSYYQPITPCPVVSTVGAGDSYSAGWITSWFGGNSVEQAMKDAAALSDYVVAHKDAIPFDGIQ